MHRHIRFVSWLGLTGSAILWTTFSTATHDTFGAQRTALEAILQGTGQKTQKQTGTPKRASQNRAQRVQSRRGQGRNRNVRSPARKLGRGQPQIRSGRTRTSAAAARPPSFEAQWIWHAGHPKESVPVTHCHFRKTFLVQSPVEGQILISADDEYELYINGRILGKGGSAQKLDRYNITRYLQQGRNLIAIRVSNLRGNTAGLAARVTVRDRQGRWRNFSTNHSWKTELSPFPLWNMPLYSDSGWAGAQVFGPLGRTAPWDGVNSLAQSRNAQPNTPPSPTPAPPPAKTASNNPSDADAGAKETSPASVALSNPSVAESSSTSGAGSSTVADSSTTNNAKADAASQPRARFQIHPEFEIQLVMDHEQTGSLIAMTFNEFGHIIASRENGPLLLIYDSNRDFIPDQVKVYCDQVKNCQGILALNGDVFVTGEGPQGVALYRLSDRDRNGTLESVKPLVKFTDKTMGEHGPHGVALGPDGLLYVMVGNHSQFDGVYEQSSPHRNYYEGDLTPRYEDPGGHAQGVKAPGGVVIRTSIDGGKVELFAGGLRNAYDLAFNREGELFTFDSDMESDEGTTWYRPTSVYHLTAGSEFGWRSGWAKWPDYYADRLPPVLEAGRGSPTGMVFYNHHMFPSRYQNALFLADWSEGRILVARTKRDGAGYRANSEVILRGQPLNVTDLGVGADGWLYFATGGRGTEGGVYRVRWKGTVPPDVRNLGDDLSSAVRYPQFHSAWSRQAIATLKNRIGTSWSGAIRNVAQNKSNPVQYRLRALDLMQLFGPQPNADLLVGLSKDTNEAVRAKAAKFMGLHNTTRVRDRLTALLGDDDRNVRRIACESLLRQGRTATIDAIRPMLISEDRFEGWAARRMLERLPSSQWKRRILTTNNHRLFVQGSLALMTADPSEENALAVLERIGEHMKEFVTDRDFVDMLRVAQVAILRGEINPGDVPDFRELIAEEFPSSNGRMNREIIRLLARLQVSSITKRYLAYLEGDAPNEDKLHVGMYLRFVASTWSDKDLTTLLQFYDAARKLQGGNSLPGYLASATRDLAKTLDQQQSLALLQKGEDWPSAALGALYQLTGELDQPTRKLLIDLDRRLSQKSQNADPAINNERRQLQVGITAVLAQGGQEESMTYLRNVWNTDPERREIVAMGLAQAPFGENWDYLMKTLPILEGGAAQEVLIKLLASDRQATKGEHYRQVILLGKRLKEHGSKHAIELLEHWSGEHQSGDDDDWKSALKAWTTWFADNYPESPTAELPLPKASAKYRYDELLDYLAGDEGSQGKPSLGASVYVKAQCAKCHRFGRTGEPMGPDLTSVARRFTKKEIVHSIVYPSHIISDQYASKTIITDKGVSYTGIVAESGADEMVILTSTGSKVTLGKDEIDEVVLSKKSSMPDGLLDQLTLQEIADLIAYLATPPETPIAARDSAKKQ